ncbi:alpha-L-fucosidase [Pedobacter sp. AK017]|uniref:alpha-L-fucosidase n=1 Tax=Pedobacter sp. AK017 TaxID=2723073 RepID=UPI00160AB126|nr:alpha-L-fucosidase [Pedobacter sp. AK017]MBB5437985.1 alpha-L-fucosidase [Pedobacter sp. AK017]
MKKHTFYITLAVSLFLMTISPGNFAQTYQPEWQSLDKRQTPSWWTDAKFGIFIHWGLYSVPAYAPVNEVKGVYEKYAEHYENRLIQGNKLFTDHHKQFYGEQFKYSDFAAMFKAEYFKPEEWADLFAKSGAKYVVLTSKHHDGFCLWPSAESNKWNSVDAGPHRDLAGDLTNAVKDKGLKMGFYYSLLEWSNPLYKPQTIDNYVENHMLPQMKDLVTRYKPEVIFADGEWDYPSEKLRSPQFLSWLYNESAVKNTVVVNDRWGKETRSKHGGYYTTEYDLVHDAKGIGEKAAHPWEESRGIGTSYGFNRFETLEHYFTSKQLVDLLIDKVSNGGNLLLNIGPDANGLIPIIMQERLLDIGAWLKVNGEAIYGSSSWIGGAANQKDKGIFYTQKGKDIYIICTKWPQTDMTIGTIKKAGKVSLLGSATPVKSEIKRGELHIIPPILNPATMSCQYAWVFKVKVI